MKQTLTRLLRIRNGAVGVIFAFSIFPLVLAVGVATDYHRSLQVKAQLQEIADASALAAAADESAQTSGATEGTNTATLALTKLTGATSSSCAAPVAGVVTESGQTQYTDTVTCSASVKTTFLGVIRGSIPVGVTATANNPAVLTVDTNGGTNAGDLNKVYWYKMSVGNEPNNLTVPATSTFQQTSHQLYDNANGTGEANSPTHDELLASDVVGFALVNVTGGRSGYGCTQYGGSSTAQSQQIFYSQYVATDSSVWPNSANDTWEPPSYTAFPPGTTSGATSGCTSGATNGPTTDCSLQTAVVPNTDTSTTWSSSPDPYNCTDKNATYTYNGQSVSLYKDAIFSCNDLTSSNVAWQYWNDMGGPTDDKDYNDMVLAISCQGTNSGSGGDKNGTAGAVEVYLSQ